MSNAALAGTRQSLAARPVRVQFLRLALPLVLCLAFALGFLRLHPYTAAYGDEGLYLMLGQSLRFEGSYREIGMAGQPIENVYPPGLPLIFAATMWLTDTGAPLASAILPAKIVILLLFVFSLFLLYDLLRRRAVQWVALTTVLAVAVLPLMTDLATQPMTDAPFLSVCLLALWLVERAGRASTSRGRWAWVAVAGFAAGFASNIRLEGAALTLAGALFLLGPWLRRSWRERLGLAALFVGIAVLMLAPWLYYGFARQPQAEFGALTYVGQATTSGWSQLAGRFLTNLRGYGAGISGLLLHQPWRNLPDNLLAPIAGKLDLGFALLLVAIMAPAFIRDLRRYGLIALFTGIMALALLVWPYRQQRYLLPLAPFLLFYLFAGLDWLRAKVAPPAQRWATLGAALFIAAMIGYLALVNAQVGLRTRIDARATDVVGYHAASNAQWARFFDAAAWVAQAAPTDATIVSRKPSLVYLFYERPGLDLLWSSDAAAWLRYLNEHRVNFVIEDAFTWSDKTDRFLNPTLSAFPDHFKLVYQTEPPVTRVWQFIANPSG